MQAVFELLQGFGNALQHSVNQGLHDVSPDLMLDFEGATVISESTGPVGSGVNQLLHVMFLM